MIAVNLTRFADSSNSASGIGAFNINLKAFIFQLVTFLIVLAIFKKWILPPITKTIEARRTTLEKSLEQAKQTEETLAKAEASAEEILARARAAADESIAEAKKTGKGVISEAEDAAAARAALIVKEAEARLGEERDKLRQELRAELADLVADTTEKLLHEKLDAKHDRSLIEQAVKEIAR